MANGYHTKQGRKSPNQVHVCWLCTCILWQDAKGCMEQVAASNDVAGANDSLQSTRVLKENQHFGKPSVQLVGTSIWVSQFNFLISLRPKNQKSCLFVKRRWSLQFSEDINQTATVFNANKSSQNQTFLQDPKKRREIFLPNNLWHSKCFLTWIH